VVTNDREKTMSGSVADKKRLLKITAGNIRQSHIYINGHLDFFPEECVYSKISADKCEQNKIEIFLVGLNRTIFTNIAVDDETGKPGRIFRERAWIKRFFKHHSIQVGDILAIERMDSFRYRLYPFESKSKREFVWQSFIEERPRGKGPTVIELFAGCGGMLLGFKNTGYKTVLANEWDSAACDTIRMNLTDRVAQCAVQEIERFPKADIVIGGPPCQGFSNLGEKVPNDPRRQLWRQFMRAVSDADPYVFIIENVPPILSSQEFIEINRIAASLGYSVMGQVMNTADYGVPQTRKRAIIIGCKGCAPSFPEPTHFNPDKIDLLNFKLKPWLTVKDAIGDLPLQPDGNNWHIGRNPTEKSIRRYSHIPAGGNRWDLPDDLMPDCWKRKTKGGTDLFGRLWWNRPSVTIRTEFYKPEKGRYLHPQENRPITHREAARLQGFPDDFFFVGTKTQVGIQIGNAVPPPFAEALAKHASLLISKSKKSDKKAS